MNSIIQYTNNIRSRAYKNRIRDRISNTRLAVFRSYIDVAIHDRFVNYKNDKYKQINNVIQRIGYYYDNSYFYYYINERLIASNNHRIIDNMPIDYSIFAKKSLNDIKDYVSESTKDEDMKNGLISIVETLEKHILNIVGLLHETKKTNAKHVIKLLQNMINKPSACIDDALQRILIWNSLLHQTGHTLVGLGRIDYILDDFENDSNLEVSLKEFYHILHNHYIFKSQYLAGDTGQLIILGGIKSDGDYFCNKITYEILRVSYSLNIPDPKVMLRVSKKMPDDLLHLAVNCIAKGNGSPILANDDIVIPALIDFGYQENDANNYGVSACWEPLIIGESLEQNNLSSVNICKPLIELLHEKKHPSTFSDFLSMFLKRLETETESTIDRVSNTLWEPDPINTLATLSCLKQGKDISQGGAKYNNYGILTVGLPNAVNSLINIRKYIYDQSIYSFDDIVDNLDNDYRLNQDMKQEFASNQQFGQDNEYVIQLTNQIFSTIKDVTKQKRNCLGGGFKVGLSSPSYLDIGKIVPATPDGRECSMPLHTHISTGQKVAFTEIMNFASQINYMNGGINGNVVDIMTSRTLFLDNIDKYYLFFKQAIINGFFEMQMNVLDSNMLKDAKLHPEKYTNLIVRVWGFSAYFNDLPEEYKDNLIRRAIEAEQTA